MYSLTICFGPTGTTWALLFKDEDKAGVVYNAYVGHIMERAEGGVLIGSDDFGQSFAIEFDSIRGMVLEDMDVVEHAHIQRQLANARMQFKAQEQAKTDPVIRQAMGAQQRAPILQPMGNGRFGN